MSSTVPAVAPGLGRRTRAAIGRRLFGRVTERDVREAKADALQQLRIGRTAHYYTVGVFVGLLLDGFLALYFPPNLNAGAAAGFGSLYFLGVPILAGFFLAVFGVRVKWGSVFIWPWERHLWLTAGAVLLNFAVATIYFAHLFAYGAPAHWNLLPWFYPVSLLGPGAALAALAVTWSGWGHRKIASLVAALAPVPLAFAVYLPSVGSATGASDLALSLIASGGLFLASGSFLHLISSGTRLHEREVLRSGQNRLFAFAEELRRKEEALLFRETSVVRREADAESAEKVSREKLEGIEEAQRELAALDDAVRSREAKAGEADQRARLLLADMTAQRRTLDDRTARLELRETDVESRAAKFAERERAIVELEGAVTRQQLEVTVRDREVGRRETALKQGEARLQSQRSDLETQASALTRRESQIKARAGTAWEGANPQAYSVAEREARLTRLRGVLDEQNQLLGQKAREVDERLAEAQRRDAEHAQRQAASAQREATLREREADLAHKLQWAQDRQSRYEEAVTRAETRLGEIDRRQAELEARGEEHNRAAEGLAARERVVAERQGQLTRTRSELERTERALLERQRELESRESELSLRTQAMAARMTGPGFESSEEGGDRSAASAEREKTLDWRERQLREREAQLTRREYEAQHAPAAAPDAFGPSQGARRIADRLPTGTPRLDDLLLGGLPPNAHVLLVGPPFTGKEVALYGFIAEGLKRGEAAVLVTASRPPEELSQEIGVASPQFREYEQLGRVVWIDASNPSPPSDGATASGDGGRVRVRGPADHKGILSALTRAAMKFERDGVRGLRVGFLGLSACLAHGDGQAAFAFLQNFVGILKARSSLAIYVVDRGAITDTQVETVQARMDGALQFKSERGKSFLSVQGLGDVATREWIEYRATNRALAIGSFSLERIR